MNPIMMVVIGLMFQLTPIPFDLIASPTPIPSATPALNVTPDVPTAGLLMYLSTAESSLSGINNYRQAAVMPAETGNSLFGYAKWIASPNSAEEVFGPFGPIFSHLSIVIGIVILLALVYFLLFIGVLLIRMIIWVITQILKLIPTMG